MISIRKARSDDFEKIYPLLLEFNDRSLTKDDWKQLFINRCGTSEDYVGFALYDQDTVVGFLGLIFSHRSIGGIMRKFCNMTSYIVKKEYRGQGLSRLLLSEVLKLREYTVTTLPPPAKTLRMHLNQGFKELDNRYRIIFPVMLLHAWIGDCSVLLDADGLESHLTAGDLKVLKDHASCRCVHVVIKKNDEICYIIARRIWRKGLPFIEVHYVNNLPMFIKYIGRITVKLLLRLRVWGIVIEERLLQRRKIRYSISRTYHPHKLFKSSFLCGDDITDNLYTESVILK